jgi:hypothetical protein
VCCLASMKALLVAGPPDPTAGVGGMRRVRSVGYHPSFSNSAKSSNTRQMKRQPQRVEVCRPSPSEFWIDRTRLSSSNVDGNVKRVIEGSPKLECPNSKKFCAVGEGVYASICRRNGGMCRLPVELDRGCHSASRHSSIVLTSFPHIPEEVFCAFVLRTKKNDDHTCPSLARKTTLQGSLGALVMGAVQTLAHVCLRYVVK